MTYPLMDNEADRLRAFSERPLSEITLDAVSDGSLSSADLRIHAETLRAQAEIARQAGYEQLAANLLRAAELTVVPNEELLKMYDLLRPSRASWEQLMLLAERLETTYNAVENARFVREAAEVYKTRGLLRR
ncbi:MAG TPA: diol dehydratase small subunit [Oceanobacillus sp.]|nr:diol dehydratase small subunit [Oceanobacillus sp.]